jgi:H+-translocating NAD(P) transhydrogenase subunit alpha
VPDVDLTPPVRYTTPPPRPRPGTYSLPENSSAPSPDGAAGRSPIVIGAPAELRAGERRVAITPAVVAGYIKLGATVVVESAAGERAGFPDSAYVERGAVIGTREDALAADVVVCVRVVGADAESADLERLRSGQAIVGMAAPLAAPEVSAAVASRGAVLFSLELLPRTTRAQSMDVLSSQANIAGYRAVLIAAQELPKVFPLLTTAAGTIPPARVFVVGAGVAGLSAIATARRLGAVVEAYDVREAAREEVQSLGARFVELPLDTGQEGSGSGAYASAMSDEALARQRELMLKTVAGSDVVITTAQVQGARAPVLITTEMVEAMSPGSVVVDLAAEQGGNCAVTLAGRTVDVGGVRVIGPIDVPSGAARHASLTYAKNVANFVALLVQDGALVLGRDDDLVTGCTVCRDGEIVNERVSAALGAEEGVAT